MIATIHTFGRDLKWNPHIHCLIPELIYSFKRIKTKTFHHFNFIKLRKTFQFELIRLIQEAGGLKKPEERTDSIKTTQKVSMSMPNSNP
ncbi:MAG: transposase [Holdemanella porci]